MAKEPNQQVLTKKHLARLERERMQQRYLVIGTVVVLVLVVGLVIYGVLDQTILKSLRPVAKAGNTTITASAFQKEVKFTRFQYIDQLRQMTSNQIFLQFYGSYIQQIYTQLQSSNTLGQQVINSMVEDAIVQQEAKKRNITVSDAEVNTAFQAAFGYFPNGTQTPTPSATPFRTSTFSATQTLLFPATSTPNATTTAVAETAVVLGDTATVEAVAAANTATAQAVTPTAGPSATPVPPTATATATVPATPTSAFTATASATPTITQTPTPYTTQAFSTQVNQVANNMKSIGYTKDDLRALIRRQLLRQKVVDAVTKGTPTTAEEVWARHILVKTEDEAKKVEDRLAKGEKFDDLAKELSTDTGSASSGGDLGWFTKGQMVAAFEDAAFKLKVGEISQPVKSDYGFHIIQVLGHETRPLTAQQLSDAKSKAYTAWLDTAKKDYKVQELDWASVVPTDPAIPADLDAQLQQMLGSQGSNSGLPIQTLPTAASSGK
ncbi:MAG TPA: peptidylprolyl isomerase [Anaerolineaceae bacterium]